MSPIVGDAHIGQTECMRIPAVPNRNVSPVNYLQAVSTPAPSNEEVANTRPAADTWPLRHKRVLLVGAGAAGMSIAYHLSQRLEKFEECSSM
ncbi:hypothetical protein HD806DRAFT_293999 [Xylariaceae sp. AK1471]|nr:hypothetical protein HD806DRAFT_293999 [Xylariaceae sp. AK1471]